jgi:hypothetical protein
MSKRIVAYELTGIRRIVGTVDQLSIADGELPVEIGFDDGRIFSIVGTHSRYIKYQEKPCGSNSLERRGVCSPAEESIAPEAQHLGIAGEVDDLPPMS